MSRLREFEENEGRSRQFVVAVSANIEDNIVGVGGFDLQRSKPLREKDISNCMAEFARLKGRSPGSRKSVSATTSCS